ncbi:hypothetical protein [Achromobacter xylosoxidans]|uniref:Uncharacterized protein n=1 Tax=Alcaligenes xylosoxydans xylosoxydans TaxID=85698 RepID=A0A1R1JVQ8_ALCXX|nr:hypothetical protein [Achromobacter xylosoxidans]OMG89713.1 hypothetical protein BIZ92_23135 [Achromobacter xylosoxidans]
MPNTFGPSFDSELAAAGLLGLPFVWYADGTVSYGEDLTAEQRAVLDAVVAGHDPTAPAPVAVPETVTKYQACVVLARHGLLDQVDAFFAAMVASDQRRLAWEMAAAVHRHSESTLSAIPHLGLSEAQADSMFIEASQVE